MVAGTRGVPVASDPYVSAALPAPVAAEPYIPRLGRNSDDLHLRRGRSHIDGAADIDHRGCGDRDGTPDDAAAEQRSRCERREYQGCEMSAFHSYWLPSKFEDFVTGNNGQTRQWLTSAIIGDPRY